MKTFLRLCWVLFAASLLSLKMIPEKVYFNNVPLTVSLGTAAALTGIAIFVCLLCHWYKTRFSVKFLKILWLVILFLYYPVFLGPAVYYILVVELSKTVSKKK